MFCARLDSAAPGRPSCSVPNPIASGRPPPFRRSRQSARSDTEIRPQRSAVRPFSASTFVCLHPRYAVVFTAVQPRLSLRSLSFTAPPCRARPVLRLRPAELSRSVPSSSSRARSSIQHNAVRVVPPRRAAIFARRWVYPPC